MAEGVGTLPEAPYELHAASILPSRIHLNWKFHNTTDKPVWFEVRYTETQEKIPPHPLDYGYVCIRLIHLFIFMLYSLS